MQTVSKERKRDRRQHDPDWGSLRGGRGVRKKELWRGRRERERERERERKLGVTVREKEGLGLRSG